MRKFFASVLIVLFLFSTFSVLAPQVRAEGSVNSNEAPGDYTPIVPEERLTNSEVLVIEDIIPWYRGYWPYDTDAVPAALDTLEKSYDLIHSDRLATIDLTTYKIVILASTQGRSTYERINANIDKINAFVSGGGIYIAHACDYGWGYPYEWSDWSGLQIMPGGVTHVTYYYSMYIHITNPASPVVAGLNDAYFAGWGYSTHGYFTNVPPWADVVMVTETYLGSRVPDPNKPTYIVYSYGSGKVLATMQTIEWGWGGVYYWVGGFRREFLLNEIKYAQTLAVVPVPLHIKAAELAKEVIGAPYAWGAKGWSIDYKIFLEWELIHTEKYRYYYKDYVEKQRKIGYGPGLDCSGLVFWSYNKASRAYQYQPFEIIDKNVKFLNPVAFEGAENQYGYNVDKMDKTTTKDKLQPGDLVFFNTPRIGNPDHVAIYVGDYEYPGGTIGGKYYPAGTYDCVEARQDPFHNGIVPRTLEKKRISDTYEDPGLRNDSYFKEFGRVKFPVIISPEEARRMGIICKSPVDLIVTDPEGFTVTKDIREVPDMVYVEFDIDEDGKLDDIVIMLERKIGDYLITVVPEPDALPTDTYTLVVEALINGEIITLIVAKDVPISEIPIRPYILRSTEKEIFLVTPPVGGIWTPIYKFELSVPWISLASLITVTTIAISVIYIKQRKKKQD